MFCLNSAIVNFNKFKGSREDVYDNAIAEVVSIHLHFFNFCAYSTTYKQQDAVGAFTWKSLC